MRGILSATKSRSVSMTSAAMNQLWVIKAKCGLTVNRCNQRTERAKVSRGRYAFKPEANARPRGVPKATISMISSYWFACLLYRDTYSTLRSAAMRTTSSWVHENSDDIRTDESYCEKPAKLTYPP